jgi:hypothetical protein
LPRQNGVDVHNQCGGRRVIDLNAGFAQPLLDIGLDLRLGQAVALNLRPKGLDLNGHHLDALEGSRDRLVNGAGGMRVREHQEGNDRDGNLRQHRSLLTFAHRFR